MCDQIIKVWQAFSSSLGSFGRLRVVIYGAPWKHVVTGNSTHMAPAALIKAFQDSLAKKLCYTAKVIWDKWWRI